MENKGIRILSICLALLFSAAVVFFVTGITIEYKNSPSKTQGTLTKFIADTSIAAEYYLPGTREFSDVMRARIASNQSIAVVSIKQSGTTVFAYPVSSPYICADSNGEPLVSSSSALVNIKTKTTNLAGKPSIITVAIYTLQPTVVYSYTRIAFLIVLGGTLIAGIALLYLYMMEPSPKTDTADFDSPFEDFTGDYIEEQENFSFPQGEPVEDDGNDDLKPYKEIPKEVEEIQQAEPLVDEQNEIDKETPPIAEQDNDTQAQEKATPAEDSEPTGLFSPVTGFGWESYLENRLDSELVRSASTEEDIALLIVRIQNLDRTSEVAHKLYDILLDFFKFRDSIFEYKKDGFSCILHSSGVDNAITIAEQLYAKITKTLEENGLTNETGIGISTRSFRLIPGKRLFIEAEQALEHAFDDNETAIVAFKVDPSKYRQYISENCTD